MPMSAVAHIPVVAGAVLAAAGAIVSILVIAGFNYPLWVGRSHAPGSRALRIAWWMGGLPWAAAFALSLAGGRFGRINDDILLVGGVVLSFFGLLLSPVVSVAIRGPVGRSRGETPPADGIACPNHACGHLNRPIARYCAQCGTAIDREHRDRG